MTDPKRLIVIAGPTASGKSALAVELAKRLNSAVINADSRQVYSELSIGTARPHADEMQNIPHYLFGHISIHQEYNASIYEEEASTVINELFNKYNTLILCGGTGLYIQALIQGLDPLPGANPQLRRELEERLQTEGIESLVSELKALDTSRADNTDLKNPRRVIRALEIAMDQGDSIKKNENQKSRDWQIQGYYLDPDREKLYSRINQRVDEMMDQGLEDEARSVYEFRELKALQTVGYSELFTYFAGDITREKAIELIKQHTRNYAKRQLTWFRNKTGFKPIRRIDQIHVEMD